jgi:hypothetical protein
LIVTKGARLVSAIALVEQIDGGFCFWVAERGVDLAAAASGHGGKLGGVAEGAWMG